MWCLPLLVDQVQTRHLTHALQVAASPFDMLFDMMEDSSGPTKPTEMGEGGGRPLGQHGGPKYATTIASELPEVDSDSSTIRSSQTGTVLTHSARTIMGKVVAVYAHAAKENDDRTHFRRERCTGVEQVTCSGLVRDINSLKTQYNGRDTLDRAVLMQCSNNYERLRARFPEHAASLKGQSASGENLEVKGLTIERVCLGDVFSVVPAPSSSSDRNAAPLVLEVTSPRKPCIRWDKRYKTEKGPRSMRTFVMKNTLGGIFMRVVRDGDICDGDTLVLQHRPHPQWPISRVGSVLYGHVSGLEISRDDEDRAESGSDEELRELRAIRELGIRDWKEIVEDVLAEREGRESEAENLQPAPRLLQASL